MNFQEPRLQTIQLLENRPVDVLRVDAIDPVISGNKWYKLKYNLQKAVDENAKGIVTFGGQHSNHLAAAAEACKRAGFHLVAIVRAEDKQDENETLEFLKKSGATIKFVSRTEYRNKHLPAQLQLWQTEYDGYFFIPEGGANDLGRKGCVDMAAYVYDYDYVFCACGTGTMFAGLREGLGIKTVLGGINVLKGNNQLVDDVNENLPAHLQVLGNEVLQYSTLQNSFITDAFAFKGYACFDEVLLRVVQRIKNKFDLQLDYVYTAKLVYAVEQFLDQNKIPQKAKVALIHSGGVQGNAAFERRYGL